MVFCKGVFDIKGFKLDSNGDVVIQNNQIQMIEGEELLRQKVKCVLGTNRGEWPLNVEEGITFSNVLGKFSQTMESEENKALKNLYETQIARLGADSEEAARRLQKRLDGDE